MGDIDMMEYCEKILVQLEESGFAREELPGPGDLLDAIVSAGYTLTPVELEEVNV